MVGTDEGTIIIRWGFGRPWRGKRNVGMEEVLREKKLERKVRARVVT